jgi:hypothetical protein
MTTPAGPTPAPLPASAIVIGIDWAPHAQKFNKWSAWIEGERYATTAVGATRQEAIGTLIARNTLRFGVRILTTVTIGLEGDATDEHA